MKSILKRITVFSLLGLMQLGLFATAAAAPRVEEPPFFENCCGDPVCLEECAQGVTPECRENHRQQPREQENNDKQHLNREFQQGQSQSTCDN